ncbi:MAG: pilus assembly protein MshP [Desulfuromonas sp.]|nr:pilus assembly protein MshP [Desulfuromonas sp.]
MVKTVKNQRGFTIVQALFVLVVLALLGTYMVTLSTVQQSTVVQALQQTRAYHAARSGLEWGLARATTGVGCAGSFDSAEGFRVTVSCGQNDFTEGVLTYTVYDLTAVAVPTATPFGSPDYVSRTLEVTAYVPH